MSERVRSAFAEIEEGLDPDVFARKLTEDVRLQIGGGPAVIGRSAARDAVAGLYRSISSMHHVFRDIWDLGDTVIAEADVHYVRTDGRQVIVPCTTIWRMRGELIADDRLYLDPTPLLG